MIETPAWKALLAHHAQIDAVPVRERFATAPQRFQQMSVEACGLLLDYSKNRLVPETIELLIELARQRGVEARRDAMFAGDILNRSEQRAVLHTALRAASPARLHDGDTALTEAEDSPDKAVAKVLRRMADFVDAIRSGTWLGHDGQRIRTIVHIGIGGSDLGPRLACEALTPYGRTDLAVRFVSNVDAHELVLTLEGLDAATTLFIIASKTFTTIETMTNAHSARTWCLSAGVPEQDLHRHFVAVSTNLAATRRFGIAPANMFPLWDWVGGRFSLWSAIGLPLALQCGMDVFLELHAGARAMDQHFRDAPLTVNMPVILALIGIWNINILGCPTLSVAPYHHLLSRLPAHLQQLEMESNGKSVDLDGHPLTYACAPVIWGQSGTNGQHAYFQWLHQARDQTAVDFIAAVHPAHGSEDHQRILLANCLAQSEALMRGKSATEVEAELLAQGLAREEAQRLAPHKACVGNRPSNTLLMPRLDAFHLGALLALYEHKVMVQGTLWGINSFDQWGVEWGKVLAGTIEAELAQPETAATRHDSSTRGLINAIRRMSFPDQL